MRKFSRINELKYEINYHPVGSQGKSLTYAYNLSVTKKKKKKKKRKRKRKRKEGVLSRGL